MPEEPSPLGEEVLDEAEVVDEVSEYDLLFPVVPPEDDPYGPDEADTSDLVSDIEEQQDPAENEQEVQGAGGPATLDEFREDVAFDWTTLEFFLNGAGEPLAIEGAEAVVGWANTALNTPRGKFAIFSPDFGSNLQALLGQVLSDTVLFAEVARDVEGCLLQHPRITQVVVDQIYRMPNIPDAMIIDFSIFIDDNDEPLQMQHIT